MLGSEYKWLLAPARPAATGRTPLARHGAMTVAVAGFCLACTFLAPMRTLPSPAAVAAPVVTQLDQAQTEWPHVLVRLWLILPQLLPGHN